MQYDIQYIVKPKRRGGFLCGKSNLFPTLTIRYRTRGSRRWICLGRTEIDQHTYRRFRNTYYKDFKKSATDLMTLESASDCERLDLFMAILDAEFCGSIDRLVESVVREKVVMEKVDSEERIDVDLLAKSLVTGRNTVHIEL